MPGLLRAVVAVDVTDEGVRVGVLAGELLEQVGHLLAGEDQHAEERRPVEQERKHHPLQDAKDRLVESVS